MGDSPSTAPARGPLLEIASTFLRLGGTSFGGPVAHLGFVRDEVVVRRGWLDDARYAELVALCQFLPGPASSQVVFAVGLLRGGLLGACLASLCFTMPSALVMLAFARGLVEVGALDDDGWLHGLKLAAVAVVAQAVFAMGKKLVTDLARLLLCLGAALVLVAASSSIAQIGVIAAGALLGRLLLDVPPRASATIEEAAAHPRRSAFTGLGIFGVLLAALPFVAGATSLVVIDVVDCFYRAGALVFGGGHVVLPLLRAELVPSGLVDDTVFLAGYGVAQAVPGPLFTFAAFLGASIDAEIPHIAVGLVALGAVFLPGFLLVAGALPFWRAIASRMGAQAALAGANAAVVGVLLAAFVTPVVTEGITRPLDVALAIGAFALLERFRTPPWLVVALLALVAEVVRAFAW